MPTISSLRIVLLVYLVICVCTELTLLSYWVVCTDCFYMDTNSQLFCRYLKHQPWWLAATKAGREAVFTHDYCQQHGKSKSSSVLRVLWLLLGTNLICSTKVLYLSEVTIIHQNYVVQKGQLHPALRSSHLCAGWFQFSYDVIMQIDCMVVT